jgi:tetratricopeptide (TPR) repeat protein
MAKQQRPQPKSKSPTAPAEHSTAPPVAGSTSGSTTGAPRRSTYVDAVAVYEKGLDALQRHDYNRALELFERLLSAYPEERELHERVRLYLNVCRRHATPRAAAPQTVQERLYASTLALNGGRYDEAISHLRLVRDEDPDNDHALYMLAVAHAQRGEHAESIAHLERAIALNPENRAIARRDADLEPLRDDEAFLHALESTSRGRS